MESVWAPLAVVQTKAFVVVLGLRRGLLSSQCLLLLLWFASSSWGTSRLFSLSSVCSSPRVRGGRVPLPERLLHPQPVALRRRQRLRGQQRRTVRWAPTHPHAPAHRYRACTLFPKLNLRVSPPPSPSPPPPSRHNRQAQVFGQRVPLHGRQLYRRALVLRRRHGLQGRIGRGKLP